MKKALYIFILTFILNFIWEVSQSVLFMPHYIGLAGLIQVHFIASIIDIFIIFFIFILSYIIFGFNFLKDNINIKNFLILAIIGFILSVLIEKYSVAKDMWQYNSLMPIIPLIRIGLTPVMQMMLIPPVLILFINR